MNELVKAESLYQSSKNMCGYKSLYQTTVKRGFDIVGCVLALPFFFALTIPISIAIKTEDKGPIFYKSRRLGKDFQEFGMLKFRSMKVDSPDIRNSDGSTYNSKEDTRVTKIGKFLRETSIDELPQIINVLVGEMSIVGPRAGDVESKYTYEDDEKDKLLVRPGITGYSQAYYRNGCGVREKRLYDAWYAHNVSFVLDVRIILRTVRTIVTRENLYTN